MTRIVASRFSRAGERSTLTLDSKARSRAGVDYSASSLQITDARGTRELAQSSLDTAFAAYHDEVRQRLLDGWHLMIDEVEVLARPEPTYLAFPALEAAVLADPRDEDAWAVLGDAWAQAGDPRGEAILLSRGGNQTDPAEFLRRKAALLPMTRRRTGLFFGRFGDDAYRVSAKFIGGLVDSIELAAEDHAPGRSTSALLELILTHPFARFLSVLELTANTVAASLEVIAAIGVPSLRTLVVRQLDGSSTPVCVGPASANLERLRRLVLRLDYAPIDWSEARFPSLAQLEIQEPESQLECERLLAWLSQHPTIEKVELGINSRISLEIEQRLEAWIAARDRWPTSLREVIRQHRIARR